MYYSHVGWTIALLSTLIVASSCAMTFAFLVRPSYAQESSLSAFTATAPTIDGIIDSSEWSNAARTDIVLTGPGPDLPATLYIMNDDSSLYLAISTDDSDLENRTLMIQFDDNNNSQLEPGEDVFQYDPVYWASVGSPPTNFDSFLFQTNDNSSSTTFGANFDNRDGGNLDGVVAASHEESISVNNYEFSHPLCSSNDVAHDFCISSGGTIGFAIFYGLDGATTNSWPAGVSVPSASQNADTSSYAKIAVAPAPPAESDQLPEGTVIATGHTPDPEGTIMLNFTDPGPHSFDVSSPSGGRADGIFVTVTSTVEGAKLFFENDGITYHYSVIPNSNALLSFPETANITNVQLTIADRGNSDDAGHIGYILPPASEQEQPPPATEPPPPLIANAGSDQTVKENDMVYLDASKTSGGKGSRNYSWIQTSGPGVTLSNSKSIFPSFSSPDVGPESAVLKFKLTVTDSDGSTSHDTVAIFVQDVPPEISINRYPTAGAGPDFFIEEDHKAKLFGTASDPDGDSLTYSWLQISGLQVNLVDPETLSPTFVAPNVTKDQPVVFRLLVSDSKGATTFDEVTVTIKDIADLIVPPANDSPFLIDAGSDIDTDEGTLVTLHGSINGAESDSSLTIRWKQIGGPNVSLINPSSLSPSFLAPEVTQKSVLVFELQASRSGNGSTTDFVTVIVRDVASYPTHREMLLTVRTNDAYTSPSNYYDINFTKSGILLAYLPMPTGMVVGIWADIPESVQNPTIHLQSPSKNGTGSNNFYFRLESGKAQGFLFENAMKIEKPDLQLQGLKSTAATLKIGYYYEEPVITPAAGFPTEGQIVPAPGVDQPGTETPSHDLASSIQQPQDLVELFVATMLAPGNRYFSIISLITALGAVLTSVFLAHRRLSRKKGKSKTMAQQSAIPKGRQIAALAMAAALFPDRDPIAQERELKSQVIEELGQELGTTLTPASNLSELLKKYTGENEIQTRS